MHAYPRLPHQSSAAQRPRIATAPTLARVCGLSYREKGGKKGDSYALLRIAKGVTVTVTVKQTRDHL